jgi:hypothetical protein
MVFAIPLHYRSQKRKDKKADDGKFEKGVGMAK